MECPEFVLQSQHTAVSEAHTGQVQHSTRPDVPRRQTDLHRVVLESGNSKQSFPDHGLSVNRPVRHTSEPQATILCVTHTGSEGAINRCLTMDWNRIHAYAFPPFHLIPAVINKIRLSQCRIVLIAPLWPNRPWFPELLSLLVSPPVSLPVIPNLHAQLKGRILHQKPGHLQLHAWELSNNHFEIDNCQAMLRSTSPKLEGNRLLKSMMQNGKSSVADQRKIDPIQATPQIVADFFTFLFSVKKCQVSTIKGYRSTISNTLKYITGYDFGSHPVLSELIKSFAIQRPVDRPLAPKWDLAFVLTHMCRLHLSH